MMYRVLITKSMPNSNPNGRINSDHYNIVDVNTNLNGEDLEYYISGWLNSKGYYSEKYNWIILNEEKSTEKQNSSNPKETRETFLKCLNAIH